MRPLRLALTLAALAAYSGCFAPEYASPGYYCDLTQNQNCPDGQTCIGNRCMNNNGGGGGFAIPKSGSYMGAKLDPMLTDASKCTDVALEPNDSISTAVTGLNAQLNLTPDSPSPKLMMMAICPTGDNPAASGHDVDYYQIDAPSSVSAVVEIFYEVKYGDLDVGIFRPDGNIVSSDGSAVSNGCTAASLQAGTYFVGVGGALDANTGNRDSNRYDLRIRFYNNPRTCTSAPGGGDLGS